MEMVKIINRARVFILGLVILLSTWGSGQYAFGNVVDPDQLLITEVSVDFDSGEILIMGRNFRQNMTVIIGDVDVSSFCTVDTQSTPQVITCTWLPEFEGDYLLIVYRGNGKNN